MLEVTKDGSSEISDEVGMKILQKTTVTKLDRKADKVIATIEAGGDGPGALADLQAALIAAGFASVDYAVLADATSLAPIEALSGAPARLLVAARIGGTRLIDNMAVG